MTALPVINTYTAALRAAESLTGTLNTIPQVDPYWHACLRRAVAPGLYLATITSQPYTTVKRWLAEPAILSQALQEIHGTDATRAWGHWQEHLHQNHTARETVTQLAVAILDALPQPQDTLA